MLQRVLVPLTLVLLPLAVCQDPPLPRELGRFDLRFPGFVEAFAKQDFTGDDPRDLYDVYISTFNGAPTTGPDPVYRVQNPGRILDQVDQWGELMTQMGEKTALWPNWPCQLPKEVSGFDGIVQTSGFLVPTKFFGQLEVYNTEGDTLQGPWNIASQDLEDEQYGEYSYHWVIFKDVDGDGLSDALTARFNISGDLTTSQLVWLKNPGNLQSNEASWTGWEQQILLSDVDAPDIVIEIIQLEAGGTTFDVLVTGELWSERVMLYYVDIGSDAGAWADPANIQSMVLADDIGAIFQAIAVDLNRDGNLEILASGFLHNGEACDGGRLYAFQLDPAGDFRQAAAWTKHILADGFAVGGDSGCENKHTPGQQRVFYPSDAYFNDAANLKPLISVSGDDNGKHYILYPQNNDKDDFSYDMYMLLDTGGSIAGTQTVADLDGDGYVEIVSAGYIASEIYVHTYAPLPGDEPTTTTETNNDGGSGVDSVVPALVVTAFSILCSLML